MKKLLFILFVIIGCSVEHTTSSIEADENFEDISSSMNDISSSSFYTSNCDLQVLDILPGIYDKEIVFNNTTNDNISVAYFVKCNESRDYGTFYNIWTGKSKHNIRGTSNCDVNEICIEIDPVANCQKQTICADQFY